MFKKEGVTNEAAYLMADDEDLGVKGAVSRA